MHWPVRPPSNQDKKRRPPERELDANVDRPPVVHGRWFEAFVCIQEAPVIEVEFTVFATVARLAIAGISAMGPVDTVFESS